MTSVIEGTVESIVPGGQALIRDVDGIVLARGGLPGERVEIRVERAQRGVRHGVVLRVLEKSEHRVEPDCALHGVHVGRCGGCDLLDLAIPEARRVREQIVDDALVRVGRIDRALVLDARRPIVAPGTAQDAFRRRAKLVIQDQLPTFSSSASHRRVPVERCPALHPLLHRALATLPRARLADGVEVKLACDDRGRVSVALEHARPGDAARLVELGIADGALRLGRDGQEAERAGDPVLRGEVAPGFVIPRSGEQGESCGSDAGVFTQATRFGGRAILEAVLEAVLEPGVQDGEPASGVRVLELFAGAGHLTVPLLHAGAQVHAVEGAPRSVAWLQDNSAPWRARCDVRQAFIDGRLEVPAHVDVIVADPPRTGIPDFPALLERLSAERLVLVSCDPATGARDLARAMAAGFHLDRITPIDAFPRTSHVEWVAALGRGRARGSRAIHPADST